MPIKKLANGHRDEPAHSVCLLMVLIIGHLHSSP